MNHGYTNYHIPLPGLDPYVRSIRNGVEIFNTDDLKYGGLSTFRNAQIETKRYNGEDLVFTVALPPLWTIILKETLAYLNKKHDCQ